MAIDERAIAVIEKFKGKRSLNRYARDLGMDPGQLWRVLNGDQGANRVIVALITLYPESAAEIAAALSAPLEGEKVAPPADEAEKVAV